MALLSGLAGAVSVTLLNEGARRALPTASVLSPPRIEVLGERALSKTLRTTGVRPPRGRSLFYLTLLADLASNALYYALIGMGQRRRATVRGAVLGLLAGLGAAFLPPRLGLGRQPGERTATRLLTVLWYLLGGVASAKIYGRLSRPLSGGEATIP
ncbi:hypothetical protein [Deinococcus sp.]|uniref:hypothetical protein n=1 Tax=Deinococcus sp. TaxID=47478 RepID=UPI003C7E363F